MLGQVTSCSYRNSHPRDLNDPSTIVFEKSNRKTWRSAWTSYLENFSLNSFQQSKSWNQMLRGTKEEGTKREIGLRDGIVFLGATGKKIEVGRKRHTHTHTVKRVKSKKNNTRACDVINQNSIMGKIPIQTYNSQT